MRESTAIKHRRIIVPHLILRIIHKHLTVNNDYEREKNRKSLKGIFSIERSDHIVTAKRHIIYGTPNETKSFAVAILRSRPFDSSFRGFPAVIIIMPRYYIVLCLESDLFILVFSMYNMFAASATRDI